MIFQFGDNPEYSISICSLHNWYSGELALPIKLSWWNVTDAAGYKATDIAITFLCFRFGLEIWRWKK